MATGRRLLGGAFLLLVTGVIVFFHSPVTFLKFLIVAFPLKIVICILLILIGCLLSGGGLLLLKKWGAYAALTTVLLILFVFSISFLYEATSVTVEAPEFSPDGKSVILGIGRNLSEKDNGIYRIDLSDMSFHRLTLSPPGSRDGEPSYSLDGSQIIFRRANPPKSAFFIMDANGSNTQEITKVKNLELSPKFSVDGKRIYFLHLEQEGTGHSAIYSIQLNGSDRQRLNDPEYYAVGQSIAISPDGKFVLVSANRDKEGLDYGMALRLIDLNGKEKIFTPDIAQYHPPQTKVYWNGVVDAAFHPNGHTIFFVGHLKLENLKGTPISDNPRTIYSYDVNTQETKKILDTGAYWAEGPNVSPDGKRMTFCTGSSYGCDKIYIADTDGSDLKEIRIKLPKE